MCVIDLMPDRNIMPCALLVALGRQVRKKVTN